MTTPEYRDGNTPRRNTGSRGYTPRSDAGYSREYSDRQYRTEYRDDYRSGYSAGSNRRASSSREDRRYATDSRPRGYTTDGQYREPNTRPRSSTGRRPYNEASPGRSQYRGASQNRRRFDYGEAPRDRDRYSDQPIRRSAVNGPELYGGRTPGSARRASTSPFDNPWAPRILALVGLVLAIVLIVNVVGCIGGAITGGQADTASQTTSESTSESASSEAGESSSSSSASQAQQGVASPWTESGYFTSGDTELDNYIKKMCDEHSTEGETFDKNAYATFIYIAQDTDYVERAENQSPYGKGWDVEYAKQFFEKGNSGNCFNYVAVTQFMLQYFGYSDAEGQPCVVKLESGNWGDHGLVFVTNKVDGKRCLVDVALSSSGWMLDINAYSYDIRNIEQEPTVKGNADIIDDGPTTIAPGNLTE